MLCGLPRTLLLFVGCRCGVEGLKTKIEYLSVFFFGGIVYSIIEILWRGFTHWTMTLVGGLCFLLLYWVNHRMARQRLFLRCLAGTALITVVEFVSGVVVNLIFRLNVWDYSGMRFHLLGQVCPQFSGMWFLLCIPAFFAGSLIRRFFAGIDCRVRDSGNRESV